MKLIVFLSFILSFSLVSLPAEAVFGRVAAKAGKVAAKKAVKQIPKQTIKMISSRCCHTLSRRVLRRVLTNSKQMQAEMKLQGLALSAVTLLVLTNELSEDLPQNNADRIESVDEEETSLLDIFSPKVVADFLSIAADLQEVGTIKFEQTIAYLNDQSELLQRFVANHPELSKE